MLFFLEKQNYFEEKNTGCLFPLGVSYMQKDSKIEFPSLGQEI